jgi:hypothetical protein
MHFAGGLPVPRLRGFLEAGERGAGGKRAGLLAARPENLCALRVSARGKREEGMSAPRTMQKLMILSDLEAADTAVRANQFDAARVCLDGALAKLEIIQDKQEGAESAEKKQITLDV